MLAISGVSTVRASEVAVLTKKSQCILTGILWLLMRFAVQFAAKSRIAT